MKLTNEDQKIVDGLIKLGHDNGKQPDEISDILTKKGIPYDTRGVRRRLRKMDIWEGNANPKFSSVQERSAWIDDQIRKGTLSGSEIAQKAQVTRGYISARRKKLHKEDTSIPVGKHNIPLTPSGRRNMQDAQRKIWSKDSSQKTSRSDAIRQGVRNVPEADRSAKAKRRYDNDSNLRETLRKGRGQRWERKKPEQ